MSDNNVSKAVAELWTEYEALWETPLPVYVFDEENKRVNVASSDERAALAEGIEYLFALAKAFEQRIGALKQRTSETGWVGRIERRVTALEDAPDYGRTVISHEARIKALEAASRPALDSNVQGMHELASLPADELSVLKRAAQAKGRSWINWEAGVNPLLKAKEHGLIEFRTRDGQILIRLTSKGRMAMRLDSAADSVTLSRAQWVEVVSFLDRYSQLAAGMAQAISDKTLEDVAEFRAEVDAALALIEQEAANPSGKDE